MPIGVLIQNRRERILGHRACTLHFFCQSVSPVLVPFIRAFGLFYAESPDSTSETSWTMVCSSPHASLCIMVLSGPLCPIRRLAGHRARNPVFSTSRPLSPQGYLASKQRGRGFPPQTKLPATQGGLTPRCLPIRWEGRGREVRPLGLWVHLFILHGVLFLHLGFCHGRVSRLALTFFLKKGRVNGDPIRR